MAVAMTLDVVRCAQKRLWRLRCGDFPHVGTGGTSIREGLLPLPNLICNWQSPRQTLRARGRCLIVRTNRTVVRLDHAPRSCIAVMSALIAFTGMLVVGSATNLPSGLPMRKPSSTRA